MTGFIHQCPVETRGEGIYDEASIVMSPRGTDCKRNIRIFSNLIEQHGPAQVIFRTGGGVGWYLRESFLLDTDPLHRHLVSSATRLQFPIGPTDCM